MPGQAIRFSGGLFVSLIQPALTDFAGEKAFSSSQSRLDSKLTTPARK